MEHGKFNVTLKDLRKAGACVGGYNKVVCALQGKAFTKHETYIRFKHDEPVSLLFILDSNRLEDALWALRCVPDVDRDARLFAVWCARQVEHLMTDQRSKDALNVAERYANGLATDEELAAARAAAWDAARTAAWAARDVARAAAWAAWAARDVARAAAWDAVWAAWAARDVARAAAWDAQKEMFIKMCNGQAPWQVTP